MKLYFNILFFYGLASVVCLGQSPGGVTGASLWLTSELNSDKEVVWRNKTEHEIIFESCESTTYRQLNFNPAYSVCKHSREFSRDGMNRPKTIITVAQTKTKEEQVVWSMVDERGAQHLLTNQRMADLENYAYINYENREANQAFLATFFGVAQPDNTEDLSTTLQLAKSDRTDLPASNFEGIIPEIIVYDRVLTFGERNKVESALAIKYGLTISSFSSPHYINSQGKVIWDGIEHAQFSHRIAGIGRDDASSLYQKQSHSESKGSILSISLGNKMHNNYSNKSIISDQSFMLWGANDLPMQLNNSEDAIIPFAREWRLQTTNFPADQPINLHVDLSKTNIYTSSDETYWLAIDKSGSGSYHVANTSFIALNKKGNEHVAEGIKFENQTAVYQFRVQLAPSFHVNVSVDESACGSQELAGAYIKVAGGTPPYRYTVQPTSGQALIWTSDDNQVQELDSLEPGYYTLDVLDARGERFEGSIIIANEASFELDIPTEFEMASSEDFVLDLSEYQFTSFSWIMPNRAVVTNENLSTNIPGTYTLLINQDGCLNEYKIRLRESKSSPFISYQAFPNPTTDGRYTVWISSEENAEIVLSVHNLNGQLIKEINLSGRSKYYFQDRLSASKGQYILTAKTDDKKSSISLLYQ